MIMLTKQFSAVCLASCCMLISMAACSKQEKNAYDITSFQDVTARKEFNTALDLNQSMRYPKQSRMIFSGAAKPKMQHVQDKLPLWM